MASLRSHMIHGTFKLYKKAYSGLSKETWLLSAAMLINRSGMMVIPFLTIYLTSPQKGFTIAQAGGVMGLFGLGAIIGAFLSGKWIPVVGFFRIQILSLLGGGLLFILLGQMNSYLWICIVTFLLSVVNEAFRPANATAVAHYSHPENLTRSNSLNRFAINMGWAMGNALGGWIASINYTWLFWIDGITNIVAAFFIWRSFNKIHTSKKVEEKEGVGNDGTAWRDKPFMIFVLLTFLFAACFFQLFTNLPAYYRNILHFKEVFIGSLGAVNGLIVAVFEMVLVFSLEGRKNYFSFIQKGTFICVLAFLLPTLFFFNQLWAVMLIILITLGEMLSMPFMNAYWMSRSTSINRGQYASFYSIAWASAQVIGPFTGAQIAQFLGFDYLWWMVAGVMFISTLGFVYLQKKYYSI